MPGKIYWLLVCVIILAACGDDSPSETATSESLPTATIIPTTLSVGVSDPVLADALEGLRDDFEALHPQISINLTLHDAATFPDQIKVEITEGAGPDVIIGSAQAVQPLSAEGFIIPIDEFGSGDYIAYTARNAYQNLFINQRLYAFPLIIHVPVIFSNNSLVTNQELDSFDTFLSFAASNGAVIQPDFVLTGGWLVPASFPRPINDNGDLNISAAELRDYLNRIQQLTVTPNIIFSEDNSAFLNGEVAFYVSSSQEIPVLREALGEALQIHPMIAVRNRGSYSLPEITVMMMNLNTTTTNLSAAGEWMRFLIAPEQQQKMSSLSGYPPMRSAFTDDTLLSQVVVLFDSADYIPAGGVFYAKALPRYNTALAQVLSGVLTPTEAAQSVFP